MTLHQKLLQHHNSYPIMDLKLQTIPSNLSVSFIIPTYNSSATLKVVLETIAQQTEIDRIKEVIVIDDLSEDLTPEIVKSISANYPIKIIYKRNTEKLYAGQSRNVGIDIASGDIIFFLDSDIAIPVNYVEDHLKVHTLIPWSFTFSFRSYISEEVFTKQLFKFPVVNYNNEFRLSRIISNSWELLPEQELWRGKEVRLYDLTDGFRTLSSVKRSNFWTLPEIALIGISSVKRDHVLSVGGFDKRFRGWGYEDISFAANLIGLLNLYAIPVISAGTFHPDHEYRLTDHKLWFQKNLKLYEEFLNEELYI